MPTQYVTMGPLSIGNTMGSNYVPTINYLLVLFYKMGIIRNYELIFPIGSDDEYDVVIDDENFYTWYESPPETVEE